MMFHNQALIVLLNALVFLSSTCASPFPAPGEDGLIRMQTVRGPVGVARRSTVLANLENNLSGYLVTVKLGTPPQTVQLEVDTGSSDTWAFNPAACAAVQCIGGAFTGAKSTTLKEIAPGGFNISYGDGSNVLGDYISDNIKFGGQTVKKLEMGLGKSASGLINNGLMGVGFDTNEAKKGTPYPNIIDAMKTQGLIPSRLYSLWLDDLNANTGTILFGGSDKTKYTGSLVKLPILKYEDGTYRAFYVTLTSVSVTDPQEGTVQVTSSDSAAPALLDSGTAVIHIPSALFSVFYNYFEAQTVTQDGVTNYIISCDVAQVTGSVNFGFGGTEGGSPVVTIKVPFSELALPASQDGSYCAMGFIPDDTNLVLGDTFLRSAYVVYDLDNKQIGLAQTKFV